MTPTKDKSINFSSALRTVYETGGHPDRTVVNALLERGLVRRAPDFELVITDAGKTAMGREE